MDSPEDGASCGFGSMETLECGGGSGAQKYSPNWRTGHSSKEQVSHVEMRGVLIGALGNPHRMVFETRLLRRDAWNQSKGSDEGLGDCQVQSSVFEDIHLHV